MAVKHNLQQQQTAFDSAMRMYEHIRMLKTRKAKTDDSGTAKEAS